MKMTSHDWRALSSLLDVALDLPEAERIGWLETLESDPLRPLLRELFVRRDLLEQSRFLNGPLEVCGVPLQRLRALLRSLAY
jgi:hypothetical protein